MSVFEPTINNLSDLKIKVSGLLSDIDFLSYATLIQIHCGAENKESSEHTN